ncbi:MAG TPA: glycosyltransferase family 1 protein [Chloroflexota bacterium]|nr:glycosyltransferase family 1 protein [Chloroflexota bacterium]
MRVVLDVTAAAQRRGGIGRYSARLAEALRDVPGLELQLVYSAAQPVALPRRLTAVPARRIGLPSKPWRAGIALAQLLRLPLDRWLPTGDVFHATDHLLPPLRRPATVFTVHDLAFLIQPQTHLPTNRLFLTALMPRFVAAATAIIADSEATRRDLLRYYPAAALKVHVVHLGVEATFQPVAPEAARAVASRYGLPERYVLFVGVLEPRKNIQTLLRAYRSLLQQRDGGTAGSLPLVIVGPRGWWYRDLYRAVRELGLAALVRFLGPVPDADLPALYSGATAFVYPSLYEGFGLPPLEALACGTPVVCSDRAALPEVVGDAALLVDPQDAGAIARALARVLDDDHLRQALRVRGLARAARFTWERTAQATVRVYEQALAAHRAAVRG